MAGAGRALSGWCASPLGWSGIWSDKPWPGWFRGPGDRQPGGAPGPEAADHIGRVAQAQGLQGGGGERGGVSLVAADDPGHLVIGGFGNSGRAARIAPPFQVVALDHDGAGNLAGLALPVRAGVDEDRAAIHGPECRYGVEPGQATAGLDEQVVDRGRNGRMVPQARSWAAR